jgi:hypothetical protein
LFLIWEDDAGKAGKLLFTGKEVFPLSPRPSHPFTCHGVELQSNRRRKKSEKTFLFTFAYLCREQSLSQKQKRENAKKRSLFFYL